MPDLEQPSYEELAAQNAELTARVAESLTVVAEQAALIESLRAEVAALRGQSGRNVIATVQVSVLIAAGVFGGRPARCPQLTGRRGHGVQAGIGNELMHP